MANLLTWDNLSERKKILLPTILFILAAYGIYALIVAWCRRQNYRFQRTQAKARPRWVTLAGGAIILGFTLWLIFWLTPPTQGQKVSLAGILGLTEGEARLASKAAPHKPLPSLRQQQPGGEPVYAHLHPTSPPTLSPPTKPSTGTKLRKLKRKRTSAFKSKKAKVRSKRKKKGRASTKATRKKKKTSRGSTKSSKKTRGKTG